MSAIKSKDVVYFGFRKKKGRRARMRGPKRRPKKKLHDGFRWPRQSA